MSGLRCAEARALLSAPSLDDGSALRLDDHLNGCAECRLARATVRAVSGLGAWEPPALNAPARERVLRVLEDALAPGAVRRGPGRRSPRRVPLAAAAAALLAAGAVAWVMLQARDEERPIPGETVTHPRASAPNATGIDGGVVAWDAPRAARVVEGTVLFEVPPGGGAFTVRAGSFVVEVVGTRFVVTAASVEVIEGIVRVTDHAGAAVTLYAGARWAATAPPTALVPSPETTRAGPVVESAASLLKRARKKLAKRDAAGARGLLAEALARPLPRALEAEVRTTIGDTFKVEGMRADAIAAYRSVAASFRGTPAADNAAFAAADLTCDAPPASACVAAMREYLAAHPGGRFAGEARDRIASHGETP